MAKTKQEAQLSLRLPQTIYDGFKSYCDFAGISMAGYLKFKIIELLTYSNNPDK